jgi:hypothetical protein
MHSPDGSIYDWGFGSLLSPINHTVNTVINQILDAATLNNDQAGFVGGGIGLGRGKSGGPIKFERGQLKEIKYSGDDLRKNIVMLNEFMKEPSLVLFQLLGFMVSAGDKLSSVGELMTGEQSIHNEPATTSLTRLEQGLKVFSAIHKRVHNGFKHEYHKIYDLNAEYLDPTRYFTIQDDPNIQHETYQSDYDRDSCDIIPTSSPEDVSNSMKMMKAEMLMALRGDPGFNAAEINKNYLEAAQMPDQDRFLSKEAPPPPPEVLIEQDKQALARSEFEFEMMKYGDERIKIHSEIMKNWANAEAEEIGQQLEQYKAELQALIALTTKPQQAAPVATAGEGGSNGGGTEQT